MQPHYITSHAEFKYNLLYLFKLKNTTDMTNKLFKPPF